MSEHEQIPADNSTMFKYHWNDVRVYERSTSQDWKVTKTLWTVLDFRVTSGQDPDDKCGKLKREGREYGEARSDRALSFEVGRKKSSGVATWFKQYAPKAKNLRKKDPGELNFAFKIKLRFRVRNTKTGETGILEIPGIYIGQGSHGTVNDWHFGGPGCTHTGGGKMDCNATFNGRSVIITFHSGLDTRVDKIDVDGIRDA